MKLICNTTDFHIKNKTAVTLGKFDGLHRGHQKLIQNVLQAKKEGFDTAVFTFSTFPTSILSGVKHQTLTTKEERTHYLSEIGLDYLIEYPFDQNLIHMSPEAFIWEILIKKLNAGYIIVGKDYHFGYKREGDYNLLTEMAMKYNYRLLVMDKEKDHEHEISSTYIREELMAGHIEKVNHLLGYPYTFSGEVIHGRALARNLGFPTMNLLPNPEKLLPPLGVYCVKAVVDGQVYNGIANVGYKPTITDQQILLLETHLFSYTGITYGKTIDVMLYRYMRPEIKFASIDELKAQMEHDVKTGKEFFAMLS